MQRLLLLTALLLTLTAVPPARLWARTSSAYLIADDEYDRYKQKGDDLYREGRYLEARRQYQNCLEVPNFENDPYAKAQIEKCTTGLALRQQGDDALSQGQGPEAVDLYRQLLTLNPDDGLTKIQLANYFERQGNTLYSQQKYTQARTQYQQSLMYSPARQGTLQLQINNINRVIQSKRTGIKIFVGALAIGAGTYAVLLRSDFQSKQSTLEQISKTVDPTGSGIIANRDQYQQYENAYNAVEAAQRKNGLYKACLGVAAVATLAEVYLLVRRPHPKTTVWQFRPSSASWGLALSRRF